MKEVKFFLLIGLIVLTLISYNNCFQVYAHGEGEEEEATNDVSAGEEYIQQKTWINSYGDPAFHDDKIKVLGDIQPGLGVLMQEIGRRFTALFYAARGGNWDLARYQLNELLEALEVGEITRPNRKDALVSFEENFVGDKDNPAPGTLYDAINKKNFKAFKRSFKSAIDGCNACHASTGHGFIKYKLPRRSEIPVSFFPVRE